MSMMNKRFLFSRLLRDEEAPGAAGGGGGGGGAGDPNPGGTPNTPPGGTPAPAWHDSIQDESLKAYITGKGFKDAGEAAKALQEAETRAALPENADAYALPVPDGGDKAFASEASKWMLEAGIPVAQAQALAAKWNAYAASQQQAQDTARQQRDETEVGDLKKEWGAQYDANVELGRRAARAFLGKPDEAAGALQRIESALGAGATLKLFHNIGKHLGEGSLTPGDGSGNPASEKTLEELMYPTMAKK
jgi:hypothetical protein